MASNWHDGPRRNFTFCRNQPVSDHHEGSRPFKDCFRAISLVQESTQCLMSHRFRNLFEALCCHCCPDHDLHSISAAVRHWSDKESPSARDGKLIGQTGPEFMVFEWIGTKERRSQAISSVLLRPKIKKRVFPLIGVTDFVRRVLWMNSLKPVLSLMTVTTTGCGCKTALLKTLSPSSRLVCFGIGSIRGLNVLISKK